MAPHESDSLRADPADLHPELALDLAESVLHRDPEACAELLEQVTAASSGRRDPELLGRLAQVRGELHLIWGDLQEAAASFRVALANRLAAGAEVDACRAMIGHAVVRINLGEYGDALRMFWALRRTISGLESTDSAVTVRLHAMVHLWSGEAHTGRGDIPVARHHFDMAEDLASSLGDTGLVAAVAMSRGEALVWAGLPRRASEELTRARARFEELGWRWAAERATLHLAEARACAGDVAASFALLDSIDERVRVAGGFDHARYRTVRAGVLLRAGLAVEAHAEAAAAQLRFAEMGMVDRSARATLVCATASLRMRRADQALLELTSAERLFSECGAQAMREGTLLIRAQVLLEEGQPEAAARLCRELLLGGTERSHPHLGVRARLILARTEAEEPAERLIGEAADLAAHLGVPELRLDVSLARARLHRQHGRPRAALEPLRRAAEGRATWDPVSPIVARGPAGADLVEISEELIGVLLDLDDHAATIEAWQWVCALKNGGFSPLVAPTVAWEPAGGRLTGPLPAHQATGITGLRPYRRHELPPVPDMPVIDYYVLGRDVVAFVVRDGQVHVRRLVGATEETHHALAGWSQERVLVAALGDALESVGSRSLRLLHDILIAPLLDLVADLYEQDASPPTIVGHRHLHAVPFDALVEIGSAPVPAPAVAPQPLTAHAPVLVLAVPDDEAPLIEDEAAMIGRLLPGSDVHIGTDATREVLFARGPEVSLVHIACHGTFRSGNPLFSALHLGDGWLRAVDLVAGGLHLNGATVVLSACGAGGASDLALEPLGLAWAFSEAGAGAVIAALWDVDDAATLELMTHLYHALAAGEEPQRALQSARRALAVTRPHPYHWAGFRYFTLPGGVTR
ncbi:CHAT domain-containing protein [Nocardioides sp. zg-ZUI104]|uniref:CHAT domain-containing protein n=1 Tax=Nocardioides faecalis TaxID=2803858 RepID=UPI001BCE1C86|nr:CHAT domain-containing protein [Nocardioides faecalis]MBS4753706.1 CHAT domain-containing protein [Nocardioides faecalis]